MVTKIMRAPQNTEDWVSGNFLCPSAHTSAHTHDPYTLSSEVTAYFWLISYYSLEHFLPSNLLGFVLMYPLRHWV